MDKELGKENVVEFLIAIKDSLPNKQKQLCSYILENNRDVGLLTVKELAEKADVGTTTVMRLIKELGYSSFFKFKKDFYDIQLDYSDKWENVQKSFGNDNENENEAYKTLSSVGKEAINVIEQSLTPYIVENFNIAMDLIANAEMINLLGLRPYKAVALYMEMLMGEFYSNTRQLSHDSETMIDRILQFTPNEVLILFGFAPYTQRTIDAAALAYKKGVPIILITDHLSCPIASFSKVILKVKASDKHFTIVPVIVLVEAIVLDLGKRNSKTSIQRIRTLFETLKEYEIIVH
ncbi:MurR/RpiR family transcriptional regulator [Sporosarcina siberiensis]|uniref:MurR/RpiR family transcriptional regulator n=1 Tax=Sporosarcina siberiensis TaxID=1365606 RepID=A0ABW4SIW7_9BACL